MVAEMFDQLNFLLTNGLGWGVLILLLLASGLGNVYQYVKKGDYRQAIVEAEKTGKNFVNIVTQIRSGVNGAQALEKQMSQSKEAEPKNDEPSGSEPENNEKGGEKPHE